ncbi:hypothetical protein ACP275_14G257800 [Erythranthe tilingii]
MEVRDDGDDVRSRREQQPPPPAPSKQIKSSPNSVNSNSVAQRLQKELIDDSLMMSEGELGVSAFPEGESIFS